MLTHAVSLDYNEGRRATCVLTSAALWEILVRHGYPARMMRIEAAVGNGNSFCVLGSFGDGTRLPVAGPGLWHGHVGVVVDDVLLDPTLDQVNDEHPGLGATPMAVQFTDYWFFVPTGNKGAEVRFTLFPDMAAGKAREISGPRAPAARSSIRCWRLSAHQRSRGQPGCANDVTRKTRRGRCCPD